MEDREVLSQRLSRYGERATVLPGVSFSKGKRYRKLFQDLFGPFYLNSHRDNGRFRRPMHMDGGLIALLKIAEYSKQVGFNVILSGCGADEIYTDYGFAGEKIHPHFEKGGIFSAAVWDDFPWRKFFYDSQRSYLEKVEFALGAFGIEGRYPFLDLRLNEIALGQAGEERLNTYKSPISDFLTKYKYPFSHRKIGFSKRWSFWSYASALRRSFLKR